jgi:hypothetical protein
MDKTAKPQLRYSPDASRIEYYDPEHRLLWHVAVDGVVLAAEHTTNAGPWADDYFLILVEADHDKLYVAIASLYSNGIEEVLRDLGQRWNANIELQLLNSTEWKSRVLWPPELVGTEYFEFKEIEPQTITNRLRKFVLGPAHEYFPSVPVRQFLQSRMNRV